MLLFDFASFDAAYLTHIGSGSTVCHIFALVDSVQQVTFCHGIASPDVGLAIIIAATSCLAYTTQLPKHALMRLRAFGCHEESVRLIWNPRLVFLLAGTSAGCSPRGRVDHRGSWLTTMLGQRGHAAPTSRLKRRSMMSYTRLGNIGQSQATRHALTGPVNSTNWPSAE